MRQILADFPVELLSLDQLGLKDVPEPEESGKNYLENALIKARHYQRYAHMPCLADDSGLEIEALQGAPGLYSHRFLSQCQTQAEKNACVLRLLQDVPDVTQRAAAFRCCCVIVKGEDYLQAQASCPGYIAFEASGSKGFGYDPIFFVPQFNKHMAELSPQDKNAISHRGQAVRAAVAQLLVSP